MVQANSILRDLDQVMDTDVPRANAGRPKIKDIRDLAAESARATAGGYDPFAVHPKVKVPRLSDLLAEGDAIGGGAISTPKPKAVGPIAEAPITVATELPVEVEPELPEIETAAAEIIELEPVAVEPEPIAAVPEAKPATPTAGWAVNLEENAADAVQNVVLAGINFRSAKAMPPGTVRRMEIEQSPSSDGTRSLRLEAEVRVASCRMRPDGGYDIRAVVA